MKLLKVDAIAEAKQKILTHLSPWPLTQIQLSPVESLGYILAEDLRAPLPIPHFRRSAVDGYAVIAADTAAAGESIPVFLTSVGSIEIGMENKASIRSGQCMYVPTGGMLPEGADAMVMIEYCETFGDDGIALAKSAAPRDYVIDIGEDVEKDSLLLTKGTCIRPQEVGALASAGITAVPVYKPLSVMIISTGDELIPPTAEPRPAQVRDINTYALAALAKKRGFSVVSQTVIGDNEAELTETLGKGLALADIILVSGGSSQGKKDFTKDCIEKIADPGVFTHGLSMKPGKPTILGYDNDSRTLLTGLPGHPVSAMMVFEMLLVPLWREMTGSKTPPPVMATLQSNVPSAAGKTTCTPAVLEQTPNGLLAKPIYGKSGLMSTLTTADGYFIIDRETEGLPQGATVAVHLF